MIECVLIFGGDEHRFSLKASGATLHEALSKIALEMDYELSDFPLLLADPCTRGAFARIGAHPDWPFVPLSKLKDAMKRATGS